MYSQVLETLADDIEVAATSHDIPFPASVNKDEGVLFIVQNDGSGNFTPPSGAGWTTLIETNAWGNGKICVVYKQCDGTEGGTNATFGLSASSTIRWNLYRLGDWSGSIFADGASVFSGNTATPDPPSLTSGFGAVDTLYISAVGCADTGAPSVTDDPANYGNPIEIVGTEGFLRSVRRELNAASEDAEAFTMDSDDWSGALTIAVEPGNLAPTVTQPISGTIEDEQGNPVENAIVKIFTESSLEDQTAPTFVEAVLTDANGDWAMQAAYDETLSYKVEYKKFIPSYTGTIDSATASSFTDTGAFTAGEFDDGQAIVRMTGGAADGDERRVTGNADTDTCDIDGTWSTNPSDGDSYEIGYMYSDELKFKPPKSAPST